MSGREGWVPNPNPAHAPFETGNEIAVKHGAYSPRNVNPLAAEIREAVLTDPATGYLAAPRWAAALWAWARDEAQCQLLTEYIAGLGEEAGNGVGDLADERVRSAYLLLHRAETRARSGRTKLGLDPLSWARLSKDGSVAKQAQASTARIMAELDRLEKAGVVVEHDGPAGAA